MSPTEDSTTFSWLASVPDKTLKLLSMLQGVNTEGYFKYALKGDLYTENQHWGLANCIFATKCYFMLNALSKKDQASFSNFIQSFHQKDGLIYDSFLGNTALFKRTLRFLKTWNSLDLFNWYIRIAETRQAYVALLCLNKVPSIIFSKFPQSEKNIIDYINKLNWHNDPWGASSHVSHLLFFLHFYGQFQSTNAIDVSSLINGILNLLNKMQQNDGSWYAANQNGIPTHQKINSAMKIISGFEAIGKNDFFMPEQLIDLCLSAVNEGHACNHFNVTYVLCKCSILTSHKQTQVYNYLSNRLLYYRKHWSKEFGGFTFYINKSNQHYYDYKVTHGYNVPDIHATTLFLWGLAHIGQIIPIPNLILRIPFV